MGRFLGRFFYPPRPLLKRDSIFLGRFGRFFLFITEKIIIIIINKKKIIIIFSFKDAQKKTPKTPQVFFKNDSNR
jgi:hypothetical protein